MQTQSNFILNLTDATARLEQVDGEGASLARPAATHSALGKPPCCSKQPAACAWTVA